MTTVALKRSRLPVVRTAKKTSRVVKPHPGSQERFLLASSTDPDNSPYYCDVAGTGGAAGGGKTYSILIDPLRHISNPRFTGVIFRRTYPQITNEGALWDTSVEVYPQFGARPRESDLEWVFPSGATIRFAHMEHEKDRLSWDGAQVPYFAFDQLEHFTKRQFFYMLSRMRSTCGVRPYIRFTCNPDPKHFLRHMLDWYIRPDGYADETRSGVRRYFVTVGDKLEWSDDRDELQTRTGLKPLSFMFVPSKLEDNLTMMEINPQYMNMLKALPRVERERLLKGNWNIDYTAGEYFQRSWMEVVKTVPPLQDTIRYWDRAASKKEGASHTAGVKLGRTKDNVWYVTHVERFRGSPLEVETRVKNLAQQDGYDCRIGIEGDPGQAGKFEADYYVRALAGFKVTVNTVHESKGTRALPLSAQAEAGNVKVLRGIWNDDYLTELENFDGSKECVSDQTDATSGGFAVLTGRPRHDVFLFTS